MNAKEVKKIRQLFKRSIRTIQKAKPWYVPKFLWNKMITEFLSLTK